MVARASIQTASALGPAVTATQYPEAVPSGDNRPADEWVTARRSLLQSQGIDLGDLQEGQLGIAYSGGGIRSATISLGVAQALAKQDRLLDFDYMSTVSGGGYFGSFLRSLFLPQSARGSGATIDQTGSKQADTDLALEVLGSEPETPTISNGMTNPIRWLRENSRYLAPAGPTDYVVAVTYIFRNWLAMLFVFALPTLLFFLGVHGVLRGLAELYRVTGEQGSWMLALGDYSLKFSMIIVIPALLLVFSIVCGVANWLTVLTADRWLLARKFGAAFNPAVRILCSAVVVLAAGTSLLLVIDHSCAGKPLDRAGWTLPIDVGNWIARLGGWGCTPGNMVVRVAAVLATAAISAALVAIAGTIVVACRKPPIGHSLFGNETRRVLTAFNAKINVWMIFVLVLALIDTAALTLAPAPGRLGVLTPAALLAPLGRWLVQKLQASFGKSTPSGAFGSFLARYLWQAAFVAAALLWGGFAVTLDVLVRAVAYAPGHWLQPYLLGLTILSSLILATGMSVGFINLSSLHSLYAARLTRAFLGASNQDRLKDPALRSITGYQAKDIILAQIYQQQCCAAPLHLINVTLNETISATGSQLLERDRKGIPMVIAPEGIWIDAAATAQATATKLAPVTCSWDDFRASNADAFSVGQLAAISGAAASSAMGSRTTLGGALLFTYANIRLGYWWYRGTISAMRRNGVARTADPRDRLGWTGTFGYLAREMTARYRSTTARVNLSDGGHFEDSGVYELLRRGIRTIVYCDNGEDAGYHFDDLENLVRKARLDIGVSVEVATPVEVLAAVDVAGARIFLNGKDVDWRVRARARDQSDPAFALLLAVRDANCVQVGKIVLLKPSLFSALPADVWGYAEQHPSFPHESTGDQFFTEAQWESYRKLGFMMMQHLLSASPFKADLFRKL